MAQTQTPIIKKCLAVIEFFSITCIELQQKRSIMAKLKRRPLERLHQLEHALEPKAKEVKQSICSFSFFVAAVKTFCLVVFFYTFSIGLTFYNQRFIRVRMDSHAE